MHGSMLTRSGMGKAAQQLLSGRQDGRPDPRYMANLIVRGLTEGMLEDAWQRSGNRLPRMEATLTETDTLIPFIQRVSDTLATDYSDDFKLFAARDADCLHDYYAIAHAVDTKKARLPASSKLWESKGWANKGLACSFLSKYGLTRSVVVETDQRITVVDTCLYGRVGKYLDEKVQDAHGRSLLEAQRLRVKLIYAEPHALGSEIIEIKDQDLPLHDKMLPRASEDANKYVMHRGKPGFLVARAIELMPRYEGAFIDITTRNNQPVALAGEEPTMQNVDNPERETDSIVNRLAAAMVQFRIVRAALNRLAYSDKLPVISRPVLTR